MIPDGVRAENEALNIVRLNKINYVGVFSGPFYNFGEMCP